MPLQWYPKDPIYSIAQFMIVSCVFPIQRMPTQNAPEHDTPKAAQRPNMPHHAQRNSSFSPIQSIPRNSTSPSARPSLTTKNTPQFFPKPYVSFAIPVPLRHAPPKRLLLDFLLLLLMHP